MEKHKGQNGIYSVRKVGYKKITRNFVAALTAVIFISGIGLYIFKHDSKPSKVSQLETSSAIPGWWLKQYFNSSVCDKDYCKPDADPDSDKLTNTQEFFYHTDPLNAFTVKDKLNDGQLVAAGFDPSRAGHVTFDSVASDDNILGESLVFNSDVKQLINESINPNNFVLPEIPDKDLNLAHNNSLEVIKTYLAANKQIFSKYFPSNAGSFIQNAVSGKDDRQISSLQAKFKQAVVELKKVSVPDDFIQLQKDSISLFQILPDVINQPSAEALTDSYNAEGNVWYDKVQAAFSLYQKMTLEEKNLETKYQDAK